MASNEKANDNLISILKIKLFISIEKVNSQVIQNNNIGLICAIFSILQILTFLYLNTVWHNYNDNYSIYQITDKQIPPTWFTIIKFIYSLDSSLMSYYLSYGIAMVYVIFLSGIFLMSIILPDSIATILFALMGYLHKHYAYLIIHYTLMKGIFANVDEILYFKLFSVMHIVIMIIGIFGVIINFFIAFITNNWYFITQRGDKLAKFHNAESVWMLIGEAIIGTLIHLPYTKSSLQLIIGITSIVIAFIKLYWILKYCIYTDFSIVKLKACGYALEITISSMIILSWVFDKFSESIGIIMLLVFSFLFCILVINTVEYSWYNTLYKNINQLKNEIEVLKHFYVFQSFTIYGLGRTIKVGPKFSRKIILNGLMQCHYKSCHNLKCNCKIREYLNSNDNESENDLYEKIIVHFSKDQKCIVNFSRYLLEEYIKYFPNSLDIKLHSMQYFLESLELYHKGYLMIQKLFQSQEILPFSVSLMLHELKTKFHNKIYGETKLIAKQGLDIMNMIICSELENKLIEMIDNQLVNMQKFWSEYLKNEIYMKKVYEIGSQIFIQNQKIEKYWDQLTNIINKRVKFPYLLYGAYLTICNNSSIMGQEFLDIYRRILDANFILEKDQELTQNSLFDNDNMYFVCSTDIENPGKIHLCSENVLTETGFSIVDLVGKSINTIIPHIYAKDHERYMFEYIETGKQTVFHATRKIFYSYKNGAINPCYLHMKPDYHSVYGMVFLGLIKPYRSSSEFILTDPNGFIDSATFQIRKDLTLDRSSNFSNLKVNISIFNESFKIINRIFTKLTLNPPPPMSPRKNVNVSDDDDNDGSIEIKSPTIENGKQLIHNFESESALYEAFKTGIDLMITVPKNVYRAGNASEKLRKIFNFTSPQKYKYKVKINDHFFRGTEIVRVYEMVKLQHDIQDDIIINDPLIQSKFNKQYSEYSIRGGKANQYLSPKIKPEDIQIMNSKSSRNKFLNEIIEEDDEDLFKMKRKNLTGSNNSKKGSLVLSEQENQQFQSQKAKINKSEIPIKKASETIQSVIMHTDNHSNRPLLNTFFDDNLQKRTELESFDEENFRFFENEHNHPYRFNMKTFEDSLKNYSPKYRLRRIKFNPMISDINSLNVSHDSLFSCERTIEAINKDFSQNLSNKKKVNRIYGINSDTQNFYSVESYSQRDQFNINFPDEPIFTTTNRDQMSINTNENPLGGIRSPDTNVKKEFENSYKVKLKSKTLSTHKSLNMNDDETYPKKKNNKISQLRLSQVVGDVMNNNNFRFKRSRIMQMKRSKILSCNPSLDQQKKKANKRSAEIQNSCMRTIDDSTLSLGFKRVESIIEKAMILPYISKFVKYISLVFLLFLLINITFGLVNYIVEYEQITNINSEMKSIHYTNKLVDDIIEINRRTRILYFLNKGYIMPDRHIDVNIADYSKYCLMRLYDALVNLKDVSNSMRKFLYESIPLYYRDQVIHDIIILNWNYNNSTSSIKEADEIFEAIFILISEVNSMIGNNNTNQETGLQNAHMNFILNNTLNDYLPIMFDNTQTFKEAIINSLNSMAMIQIIITTIGCIFLIISYLLYAILHYNLIKDKTKLLILISSINQQNIRLILERLNILKEFLIKKNAEYVDVVDSFISKRKNLEIGFNQNTNNTKKYKVGLLNKKGLNRDFWKALIKIMIIVAFGLCYYIIKFALFTAFQNECEVLTLQIMKTYSSLFNQGYSMSLTYELLASNITNSINSEESILYNLNNSLKDNADSQSLIKTFNDNSDLGNSILTLLSSNICYIVSTDMQKFCELYGDGAGTRGLIAMNTLMQRVLADLKNSYLSSNKSVEIVERLLSNPNLIQLEIMFYSFMRPTYDALFAKLGLIFNLQSSNMRIKAIILLALFIILLLVIWMVILKPLKKKILNENLNLKKFLRLIPISLFLENRNLGRYLINKCPDYFNLDKML